MACNSPVTLYTSVKLIFDMLNVDIFLVNIMKSNEDRSIEDLSIDRNKINVWLNRRDEAAS